MKYHRLVSCFIVCFVVVTLPVSAERPAASVDTQDKLRQLIASSDRSERHKARDQYRHPFETLTFMGIDPGETIAEIFPGGQGGWYRAIIEPLIAEGGGRYFPVRGRSGWPRSEAKAVPTAKLTLYWCFVRTDF